MAILKAVRISPGQYHDVRTGWDGFVLPETEEERDRIARRCEAGTGGPRDRGGFLTASPEKIEELLREAHDTFPGMIFSSIAIVRGCRSLEAAVEGI